jgi:hypothetical protein
MNRILSIPLQLPSASASSAPCITKSDDEPTRVISIFGDVGGCQAVTGTGVKTW